MSMKESLFIIIFIIGEGNYVFNICFVAGLGSESGCWDDTLINSSSSSSGLYSSSFSSNSLYEWILWKVSVVTLAIKRIKCLIRKDTLIASFSCVFGCSNYFFLVCSLFYLVAYESVAYVFVFWQTLIYYSKWIVCCCFGEIVKKKLDVDRNVMDSNLLMFLF